MTKQTETKQNNNNFHYLSGFGNYFSSEAIPNCLPLGQNSPQQVPHGLYAEQISGSAFTAPRHANQRSWLYRILPSVKQGRFYPFAHPHLPNKPNIKPTSPEQLRWNPVPFPTDKKNFITGLLPFASNGNAHEQIGAFIYLYAMNTSMSEQYFYNADGDFLIVLQEGELVFQTEFGILSAKPGEIVVIPRGIKFQVLLHDKTKQARGYICENFAGHFTLPERGPIGANGLANERDFLAPVANYENKTGKFQLIAKYQGALWAADIDHSPLNVVAWHGNYTPYKYDLHCFNTINTVSFDHPDPSIFTVLTAPSYTTGVANIDFVIFPDRWMVAEHTFRLPYYHRNIMSEFMGLIYGAYDAKEEFSPGGCSLHNCMSPHGPDANSFVKASEAKLEPEFYHGTLAFMFESRYVWQPTELALQASYLQKEYIDCWQDLQVYFK